MPTLLEWCNRAGEIFRFKEHISWVKRKTSNIFEDLCRRHESIVIYAIDSFDFFKTKGKYEDIATANLYHQITVIESIRTYISALWKIFETGEKSIARKSKDVYNYKHYNGIQTAEVNRCNRNINFTNVWSFLPHNTSKLNDMAYNIPHPTVKPILLLERLVELLTPEPTADFVPLILDPFLGSGTTAVASRNLKRQYIGFELEEDYYDICVKRLNEPLQERMF